MKNTYFSLISGQTVKRANGKKVISSEDIQNLITADELVRQTKKEAEEYKKNVIVECETIKEKAEKEGFEAGYHEWEQYLVHLEQEIAKVREEMHKLILPIALKAAKKIVYTEVATSPDVIVEIVKETLKSVAAHKKIVVYVNKNDIEIIEKNKTDLKSIFENLESFSVRDRDDIEPGGCIIQTEIGIINAKLKDRLLTLETAFKALSQTKEPVLKKASRSEEKPKNDK